MNNILKSVFPPIKRDTLAHYSFIFILLLGLFLRFYQYLMGRSLWEDEAHLALNFLSYGYKDLMKPLDYIQMAPIMFLFVVETFTKLFGINEYTLRTFPFVVSTLTLPLFYQIAWELTKDKVIALTAFLLFSVNLALIYFSSELKVYGIDVSVYLLMIYLVLSQHSYIKQHRIVLLAVAGCICIVSSYISGIVLSCIACYIFYTWIVEKKISKGYFIVFLCWAIVFIDNYFLFIHYHPHFGIQQVNYSTAFCPPNIFSHAFLSFAKYQIHDIGNILLSLPSVISYIALLVGIIVIGFALYNKQYPLLLFTSLPILLHLFISMLRIYPFYHRLILYLTPAFILLLSIGIVGVFRLILRTQKPLLTLLWIVPCCLFLLVIPLYRFPLWYREIKPSLNYINKNYTNTPIYITTPLTLYTYYYRTGYVKDSLYHPLEWAISPDKYYQSIQQERTNYLLLHATNSDVDGYGSVVEDLKRRHLIVKEFEFKTYTVSEVKPLGTR